MTLPVGTDLPGLALRKEALFSFVCVYREVRVIVTCYCGTTLLRKTKGLENSLTH